MIEDYILTKSMIMTILLQLEEVINLMMLFTNVKINK